VNRQLPRQAAEQQSSGTGGRRCAAARAASSRIAEKRKYFFWLMLPKLHSKLQVHWAYWDCPKILLVQVGTLSSSHRSLVVCFRSFFLLLTRDFFLSAGRRAAARPDLSNLTKNPGSLKRLLRGRRGTEEIRPMVHINAQPRARNRTETVTQLGVPGKASKNLIARARRLWFTQSALRWPCVKND